METERIALSQRERDRLKVRHEVKQEHLTQVEATRRLKVTDRHVRRLLLSVQERGDAAVIHGLRGQPSNRKLAAALEQKILARRIQARASASRADCHNCNTSTLVLSNAVKLQSDDFQNTMQGSR
jgi:hypothetical protein